MSSRIKGFVYLLIFLQLILLAYLSFKIYREKVLSESIVIAPLKSEDLVSSTESSQLKFFYEPSAGKHQSDDNSWLPYTVRYSINSDTLNERFEYNLSKKTGTFRITTLGDSYTFGQYVNTADNYPEKLEYLLSQERSCKNYKTFEVINLGVPGYDLEYSVERFKKRGQKYNPDLIIWFIKKDDFLEVNEIMLDKANQYELEMKKNGELDEYIKKGEYFPFWKKAIEETIKELGNHKILDYGNSNLSKIDNYYRGKLLLLSLSNLTPELESLVQNFASSRSQTYFYYLPSNYTRLTDGHPSEQGYEQIAHNILDFLKQNGIIPCI